MDILTLAYSISGLVFGAAFIPQIITLIKDRTGAASVNLSTFTLFSLCSIISTVYAIVKVGDGFLIFCTGICTLGNIIVLLLACLRRYQVYATNANTSPLPLPHR